MVVGESLNLETQSLQQKSKQYTCSTEKERNEAPTSLSPNTNTPHPTKPRSEPLQISKFDRCSEARGRPGGDPSPSSLVVQEGEKPFSTIFCKPLYKSHFVPNLQLSIALLLAFVTTKVRVDGVFLTVARGPSWNNPMGVTASKFQMVDTKQVKCSSCKVPWNEWTLTLVANSFLELRFWLPLRVPEQYSGQRLITKFICRDLSRRTTLHTIWTLSNRPNLSWWLLKMNMPSHVCHLTK